MLCRNRFLERCQFEPIDGQHVCEVCQMALEEVKKGNLPRDEYIENFES